MIEKIKWKNWGGGLLGAIIAGGAIMLGGVIIGNTAISQIAGLAVAQTSTLWNNVIDAAKGDAQSTGILGQSPYLYNGTTFDRVRGDITNGMDVDVTRISGSVTPADAYANPTTANQIWSLLGLFNGTTWDRWDAISGTNNTATTSIGAAYTVPLVTWGVIDTDAGATQTTATKAAGGGTVRHVAVTVHICYNDTAIAAGSALVHLRDGATGAGTILKTWIIGIPVAGDSKCIDVPAGNRTGSANTAMTLEFAAALTATATTSVTLEGYSTP